MTRILDAIIQYGILAFVFLIPWQARWIISGGSINGQYWEYGTRSLYATEILLLGVLFALIAKGIGHYRKHKPRFYWRRLHSMPGRLLIVLAWVAVSVLWAVDRDVALERWIVLVEAGVLFLVIASGAIPFRRLSWAIILSGSIQAVLAFVQFRWQWLPASTWLGMAFQHASILGTSVVETDMMRLLRGYGSFPHPNMLGGWLMLGLLLAVKEVKRTPFAHLAIALLSVGLAVTFSRSAWLAFIVGLAVYVFTVIARSRHSGGVLADRISSAVPEDAIGPRRIGGSLQHDKRIGLALLVMALFVGTLVVSYPEPFKERILGSGRLEEKSIQERSSGINEAWQIIKQHPVIGVGIGNYGLAMHRDIDANQPAYYYQPSHNVLLLVIAEIGVIGLVLILVFVLSFRLTRRTRRGAEESLMAVRYVQGIPRFARDDTVFLLPLLILMLFDHYLWSLYAGVMMGAVYLGIFYLKLAKK